MSQLYIATLTEYEGDEVKKRYILTRPYGSLFKLVESREYEARKLPIEKAMLVTERDLEDAAIQWAQRWRSMQLAVHILSIGPPIPASELPFLKKAPKTVGRSSGNSGELF